MIEWNKLPQFSCWVDMSLNPFRLLIVGAGVTSSIISALIKEVLISDNIEVHVWEKSRGDGGRMTTHRSSDGNTVDLGAQYITKANKYSEKHKKFFDTLFQAGILKPFPGIIEGLVVESKDFMVPNGINNMVKHYFNSSDAKIKVNTFCSEINLCKAADDEVWTATTQDGISENFNGVILTQPVPQILKLQGTVQDCLKNYQSLLEQVEYSSRYALALFYPKETSFDVPWTARYVNDHPCIRYVSIDSMKRGVDPAKSGVSILIHTSVPFGLTNLESDVSEIETIIYGYFQELFPDLPQPTSSRCIRWRYSQVFKSYPGQPGAVVVSSKPLLVLAGDAFVHSNFSGCIESANAALETLQGYLSSVQK